MRKTIAALSASLLGISGAVIAAAGPAVAVTPTCTDATAHVVNPSVSPGDDWYMTCIPKYGMGKAEFVITAPADDPFPDTYSLTDGHQTVTSTPTASQVHAYFEPLWDEAYTPGAATYTGAFMNLSEDTGDATPTSQPYTPAVLGSGSMTVAYPIKSVGPATSGLPAGCTPDDSGATYQGEYEVVYGTTITHFAETIGDVVRSVTVSYTPPPLFIGLNFTGSPGSEALDTSMPICTSAGGTTTFAENDLSVFWGVAEGNATTLPTIVETLSPANGTFEPGDPEASARATTTFLGAFAVTSTPVLATTGVDPGPATATGVGLLAVGILATLVGVVRRRRRIGLASR
ncbi:MAG TPA: hypothetical protein VHX87_11275 [Galbitalea sp.]|jgi:hypothetical protein|nr:hypothetical protein [Galbitalea sp.]